MQPDDTSDSSDDKGSDPIREANIANILAKLKAGKVLTEREERRLTEYREAASSSSRTADSMRAAAAMSGIALETIERAKAAGCPAFRGSRVYVDELAEWLEENSETLPTGDAELDAINKEIAKEKLRKWRIENDNREGKSIPRAEAERRISEYGEELKSVLRQKLEDEAPRRQRGKSEDDIRVINRQLVDEICDAISEKARWTTN